MIGNFAVFYILKLRFLHHLELNVRQSRNASIVEVDMPTEQVNTKYSAYHIQSRKCGHKNIEDVDVLFIRLF